MLFQLLKFRHLLFLTADVSLIFYTDFHLFTHRFVQMRRGGVEWQQIVVSDLRAAQQVDQAAAVGDRGGAPPGQQRVELFAGCDAGVRQTVNLRRHGGVFCLHSLQTLVGYQTDPMPDGTKPGVGVILPQYQTVFRAGGHHAVRLVGALGDKVVHQRTDIAFAALEDQRRLALELQRGVYACHKALHGGLLIAGRAVKLPGAVQALHGLGFQRRPQGQRVDAVVFDGVGRTHHLGPLQSRHTAQHTKLHFLRHGGGEALNIHFLRVQPHRLNK